MGTQNEHLVGHEDTSPAHTAGPWHIFAEDDDFIHIERVKDGAGTAFIDIFCSEENDRDIEECRANARLVAKAPELLALTRKLIIVCEDRLATLDDEAEGLSDFFSDKTEAEINDRIEHYRLLKNEATECIAQI